MRLRAAGRVAIQPISSLMFLQNFPPLREVVVGVGIEVIVLQTADRAIHFQHGQRDVVTSGNSMLPQRAMQFIHADVLFRHVRFDDGAIVHEQAGLALNKLSEAAIAARNFGDE
jgi:hypothetical protein